MTPSLPPLDGAELSFVFVFGFLAALWSRRLFAGPAVFLLLQYGVLWPLRILGTARDDTAGVFLMSHAVTVWCGSVSGICVGALLGSERMLHRRGAAVRTTSVHLAVLTAMSASVLLYVGLRGVLPTPWPSVAGALAAALSDGAAWYAWRRPSMFVYFPEVRDIRWFVAAPATTKFVVLGMFCGIDYVAVSLDVSNTVCLALRGIAIATITLVLVVVRFSPCYKRMKSERESMLATHIPGRIRSAFMLRDATSSSGSDSDSDSGGKADSDYAEYEHEASLDTRMPHRDQLASMPRYEPSSSDSDSDSDSDSGEEVEYSSVPLWMGEVVH